LRKPLCGGSSLIWSRIEDEDDMEQIEDEEDDEDEE
jgi:hypothetical protein